MTIKELIAALKLYGDRSARVVAEYDGQLYPVINVRLRTVDHYPTYNLKEGEQVLEVQYAEYQ